MIDRTFQGDCDARGRIAFDVPQAVTAYCRRYAGQRVDVEIRPRKAKRTDRQNRLFWALLTPWARDLGYAADELKDELLALLWGTEQRPSKLTGELRQVPVKGHSSALTVAEFTELIDFMLTKAAETGYVMELPDEERAARRKDARRSTAA